MFNGEKITSRWKYHFKFWHQQIFRRNWFFKYYFFILYLFYEKFTLKLFNKKYLFLILFLEIIGIREDLAEEE